MVPLLCLSSFNNRSLCKNLDLGIPQTRQNLGPSWANLHDRLKVELLRLAVKNKARTGPRSVARFKPEVHPRSKLAKCPEQEQQQQLS